ncbi:transposase (plasmid) [Lichenicola cladoniae]|uniref:Transposase n=1 Tax=Lichenicola cladoniae TaxID=1484109 RepID=A0A6M8HYY6_9PROT|nr:transposase [Lichenicola cladoniae]NPD70394.1 transposase [Acetobacteraceae bacterium]QKE93311.1 transposase [Lichenicola cladoniae]QKE93652.1 transposase [Lichenicola cladoniae]
MAKHRVHSIEFKRQLVAEYTAGETLHALARRHDISRNLIRIWIAKAEAGAFDDEAEAADLLSGYEAKIAALERLVGRQALELEYLKGALKHGRSSRNVSMSVITGPVVSALPRDAG